MGNFRQVMDALNRSCRESGAPRQVNYENIKLIEYIYIYKLLTYNISFSNG